VEEENTSAQTSTISRRGAPQADKFGNGNGLGDIFAVRDADQQKLVSPLLGQWGAGKVLRPRANAGYSTVTP
jgi:hypothetical protein